MKGCGILRTLLIGSGLIGAHVAAALWQSGSAPLLLDAAPEPEYLSVVGSPPSTFIRTGRIETPADLLSVCAEAEVQRLVVTAGSTAPLFRRNPAAAVENEVRLLLAVQQACMTGPIRQVVYASSLAVYGDGPRVEAASPQPVTAYGHAKLYAERILAWTARLTGVPVTVLRLSGVLGPVGQRSGNVTSVTVKSLLLQPGAIILSDYFALDHEHLDARDVGEAFRLALNRESRELLEVFNIGRGELIGPNQFAEALRQATGRAVSTPSIQSGHRREPLDLGRARAVLGYAPQFDLAESLAYLVEVYQRLNADTTLTKGHG